LTVVVFGSDKPGYFMAHWDFRSDNSRVAAMLAGPTGLHPYLDNFVRLSRLPVATIAEIRGRTTRRGQRVRTRHRHRFASEKAILGQFEVGVGAVPGGGRMARLGRLVGRGRTLEILLGGDDIPADLAAAYVNRLVPDAETENFTDRFARRIAVFDKVAIAGIKKLVDVATLPANDELAAVCGNTSARPAVPSTGRSPSCCSRTVSSSPTASRPTWAPRSAICGNRPYRDHRKKAALR
jgi:enoyl-CoA hydratase/carnithine racemase